LSPFLKDGGASLMINPYATTHGETRKPTCKRWWPKTSWDPSKIGDLVFDGVVPCNVLDT